MSDSTIKEAARGRELQYIHAELERTRADIDAMKDEALQEKIDKAKTGVVSGVAGLVLSAIVLTVTKDKLLVEGTTRKRKQAKFLIGRSGIELVFSALQLVVLTQEKKQKLRNQH